MLCSWVFVYFCIPETKGIPLEAMDRLFATKEIPARKAHGVILSELRMEEQQFRRESVDAGRRTSEPSDQGDGKQYSQYYETKSEV